MCIKVNVTYHGPNLTLSPTSNVVFKLGPSTPWAPWAPVFIFITKSSILRKSLF